MRTKIPRRPVVYLAGGFGSGWQRRVRSMGDFDFLDPSEHNLVDPKSYTAWDLNAIKSADIVLAYLETQNPGGYSLALEIGYARALKKKIIFVEEPGSERSRYLAMIRVASDACFERLADALEHLRLLLDTDQLEVVSEKR